MMKNLRVYDNGGKTLDRYTIVDMTTKERDIFGTRFYTYEAIGASETGSGFYQHTYCQIGRHLGKVIPFNELDNRLQAMLKNEFESQGKTEVWREPTKGEIKFGHGAIHYLTVNIHDIKKPNGDLKKWFINKSDGLRYNRY